MTLLLKAHLFVPATYLSFLPVPAVTALAVARKDILERVSGTTTTTNQFQLCVFLFKDGEWNQTRTTLACSFQPAKWGRGR